MNTRFAVAVHILTLLEKGGGEPVSSERMAGSINTNASLVRRLLGTLAACGLTTSRMGTGGGALLARPASTITLGDVYRAVQAGELFGVPAGREPHVPGGPQHPGRAIDPPRKWREGARARAFAHHHRRYPQIGAMQEAHRRAAAPAPSK